MSNDSEWKCPFPNFRLVNRPLQLRANDTLISSKPINYYRKFTGSTHCVSDPIDESETNIQRWMRLGKTRFDCSKLTIQGHMYTHESDMDRWIRPQDCEADVYIGTLNT